MWHGLALAELDFVHFSGRSTRYPGRRSKSALGILIMMGVSGDVE